MFCTAAPARSGAPQPPTTGTSKSVGAAGLDGAAGRALGAAGREEQLPIALSQGGLFAGAVSHQDSYTEARTYSQTANNMHFQERALASENDCKCGEWSFRGRVVPIRKDAPGRVSSACISAKTTVSAEKGRFVDASATDSQRCSWTCVECMRVWHTQCTKGATQFACLRGRRMFVFLGGHPLWRPLWRASGAGFAVFPKEN